LTECDAQEGTQREPAAESSRSTVGYLTRHGTLVPSPGWCPRFLGHIRTDIFAKSIFFYSEGGWRHAVRTLLREGSLAVVVFRLSSALERLKLGVLGAVVSKLGGMVTGAVIGRGAQIGPGLVVLHSHGVVINSDVKVGRNLVTGHNVTIGREKGEVPQLGDNVYIGTGAVIMGGIRVGNRARIGANAVVVEDIPDGGTAVGVPARVIKVCDEIPWHEQGTSQMQDDGEADA